MKNYLTGLFGLLTIATFVAPSEWSDTFWTPFNVTRIIIMLLFIGLVLSYKVKTNLAESIASAPLSARILMTAIPLVVLLFVVIQAAWPETASWLIRCDNMETCGINYRHGIFIKAAFELVACITFFVLVVKFARKKQLWPGLISLLLVLVTLVLAGEELSWGQRIFDWATPVSYAAINAQGETNLHNLATQLFQNTWYFGGWLLLVAFPFLRQPLSKLLKKSKRFSFLTDFLPPTYFVLIFAAAYGLVDPITAETGVRFSSILFSIVATVAILSYLILPARGALANRICLTLGVFIVALFFNLFVSQLWEQNSGAPTEYLELFIAFGIMLWALQVRKNVSLKKSSPRKA
jgi:hypothetical protein